MRGSMPQRTNFSDPVELTLARTFGSGPGAKLDAFRYSNPWGLCPIPRNGRASGGPIR